MITGDTKPVKEGRRTVEVVVVTSASTGNRRAIPKTLRDSSTDSRSQVFSLFPNGVVVVTSASVVVVSGEHVGDCSGDE